MAITDETVTIKGELHYVWPHSYKDGNSVKCYQCRYFAEDEKTKDAGMKTGECHSKASEADRTHIFTRRTADIFSCRWWFPIEKQEGENEAFIY